MDPQAVQQLITAGTALVAALSGAGVTALINTKTTDKTLASAERQTEQGWLETRKIERDQWLRDQKIKAYSSFIRHASPMHTSSLIRPEGKGEAALSSALSDIMIFGSTRVVLSAIQYRNKYVDVHKELAQVSRNHLRPYHGRTTVLSPDEDDDLHEMIGEDFNAIITTQMPELLNLFDTMVELMREDCGLGRLDLKMSVPD